MAILYQHLPLQSTLTSHYIGYIICRINLAQTRYSTPASIKLDLTVLCEQSVYVEIGEDSEDLTPQWCMVVHHSGGTLSGGASQWWYITVVVHHSGGASQWWCITIVVHHSGGTSQWWCITVVVHHSSGTSQWHCDVPLL